MDVQMSKFVNVQMDRIFLNFQIRSSAHLSIMKKSYTSLFLLLICCTLLPAQVRDTTQIGNGTNTDYLYGPIYRSSASSTFDYARFSYLFSESELLAAGIAPTAVIRGIAWNKTTTSFTNGNGLFQVYMQNVLSSTLGAASWTAITSGATQVYNNSSQVFLSNTGWQYFPFSTSFAYSGDNLQLSTNWDISSVSGNASSGAIHWRYENQPNKAIGIAGTNLTAVATLSTSIYGNNRPDVRIIYTPASLDLGVTAITSPVSDCGLTHAELVTATARNFGSNAYVSMPLELIVDGVSVGTETLGIVLGPVTSVNYTFNLLRADLSAQGRHVIQVVSSVMGDPNRTNDTATTVIYNYSSSANFDQGLPIDWLNDPNDKGKDWVFSSTSAFGPDEDHTGGGEFAWVDNSSPIVDTINLISTCVDISSFNQPLLEFWMFSDKPDSTTLLYVDIETGGGWTQILGPLGFQGNDWVKIQSCITITDPQTSVRFRATEVGRGGKSDIGIDDFRIYDAPVEDVGVVEVISPGNLGCFYGSAEPFVVAFSNFAQNTATDVAISYQVDGGAIVLDTLKINFTRCGFDTLTLPSTLDFTSLGLKQIEIWTDLSGDSLQANDSLRWFGGNYPVSLLVNPGYQMNYCEGDSMIMPNPSHPGGIFRGPGLTDSLTGDVDLTALVPGSRYSYTYQYFPLSFYEVSQTTFALQSLQNPDTLPLTDDDVLEVELGFNFVFFDQVYQSVYVTANGYLAFDKNNFTNNATTIPQNSVPNNFIALAMADLNPSDANTTGGIFVETQGTAPNRQFIVHYDSVVHFGGQGYVDGQIILHETTHIIDMQIALIQAGIGNVLMTQGIESKGGNVGFVSRIGTNNQVFSMQNEAYRYTPTPCPITAEGVFNLRADPVADLGPDSLVCDESDLILNPGSFSTYLWNNGSTGRVQVTAGSGLYAVTVSDIFGCVGSDTMLFEQPVPLDWMLLGKGDVPCPKDRLGYIFGTLIGGTPPFSYLWNSGDTTASLQNLPPGSYTQTITDVNNCELTTQPIHIQALDSLPTAAFSYILSGGVITFSNQSLNGNLFAWNFGDASSVVLADSTSHTYISNGMYQVMLIAFNDCGSDTIVQTIDMQSVGIDEALQHQIQLFPNPNKGEFQLRFRDISLNDAVIEVMDLQGRKVYQEKLERIVGGQTVSVSLAENIAKGMYLLRLKSREGEVSWKMVKE